MSRARRAICVSDGAICSVVGSALAGAGLVVEHHRTMPANPSDAALILVDRATRQAAGEALRASRVPVVVVGDDLDDDGLIALMVEAPVSHFVEDPRDRTLRVTSVKLVTGDVFGLEKYVPGARVAQRVVDSELAKRRAMDEITAWAESVGARRPVLHRLTSVVDELLMNARNGAEACRDGAPHRATVRWAADATTLALSVSDDNGALSQRAIIDHVRRARDEGGRPEPAEAGKHGGAGLGLYLVLANVASFVVNVDPGRRTEVVCLFDLARGARPVAHARSLHVFATSA